MPARYDQHFLVSEEAADRIVAALGGLAGRSVVEIGPGRGVLTGRLLKAGARVTAVEIDPRLCSGLQGRFRGERLVVINADWLELDLGSLPAPALVVSNLPYSVGAMILQRLLDWPGWERAVLMFQKEVAERIQADPGTGDYGLLTLSVRLKAEAAWLFDVPKSSFEPPPKVESAVLLLGRLARPRLPEGLPEEAFFRVARAAFAQRRKMAVNAISAGLGLARARVEEAFAAEGVPSSARAQTIGLEAFAGLARRLGR